MSTVTKVPFYIASDRPGTFVEATVGESAFANYEPDANTVGLWHLEEETGSGSYFRDSSGRGNNGSLTGTGTYFQGKIGKSRKLDGAISYISGSNGSTLSSATQATVDTWFYPTTTADQYQVLLTYDNSAQILFGDGNTNLECWFYAGSPVSWTGTTYPWTNVPLNQWNHVACTYDGSNIKMYLNGSFVASAAKTGNISGASGSYYIGNSNAAQSTWGFNGAIDEMRISNVARTADEIRQAYEIGRRTHPVTISFAANGDAGNLITGSTDYLFTVDGTAYGFQNKGDNLFAPDKIIVRENVGGTEYVAQGDVTVVTPSTGAVTVASWDAGSTFPTGGYTANASFFKWQREMFDLTASLGGQRDAVTRLTVRVTNGNEGRTVWLDDVKSSSGYINRTTCDTLNTTTGECTYTIPAGSVTSTRNRYFQQRIIISTSDPAVSPILTASQIEFGL